MRSPQSLVPSPQYPAAVDLLTAAKAPLFIYGPDTARGERGRLAVTAEQPGDPARLRRSAGLRRCGGEQPGRALRHGVAVGCAAGASAGERCGCARPFGQAVGRAAAASGPSYAEMIGGSLRALNVMGEDLAADSLTAEALGRLDFLVVQDLFLTETAELADAGAACSQLRRGRGHLHQPRTPRPARPAGGQSRRRKPRRLANFGLVLAERWQTAQSVTQTFEVSETSKVSDAKTADWKRKNKRPKSGQCPSPGTTRRSGPCLTRSARPCRPNAGIRWETLGEGGLQWHTSALARPCFAEPVEVAAIVAGRGQLPAGKQPGAVGWRHVDGARRRAGTPSHGGADHRVESRRLGRGRARSKARS